MNERIIIFYYLISNKYLFLFISFRTNEKHEYLYLIRNNQINEQAFESLFESQLIYVPS